MKHIFVVNTRGMANDTEATVFIGRKPINCNLIDSDASYRDIAELATTLCGIDGMTASAITEIELSAKVVATVVANRNGVYDMCDDDNIAMSEIEYIDYWSEALTNDDLLTAMDKVGVIYENEPSIRKMNFDIANVDNEAQSLKGMIAIEPDGIAISIEHCNGFDGVDSSKCAAFIEADHDDLHVRFYGNKGMENPSRTVRLDLAALKDH